MLYIWLFNIYSLSYRRITYQYFKIIAVPKRKCSVPNKPQGMCVQIDGNNVTTNETYVPNEIQINASSIYANNSGRENFTIHLLTNQSRM